MERVHIIEQYQDIRKGCIVPPDEPLFQPSPPSILFSDYKAYQVFETKISMRNKDKVARLIRIEAPDIPLFSIIPLSSTSSTSTSSSSDPSQRNAVEKKVAPGMDATFMLRFVPDSTSDFACNLVCLTEREKFIVPVRAVGARPRLDLPERLVFDSAPVKAASQKTFLVRNVGEKPAQFHLSIATEV
eukprot:TRINITY_DN7944_c0_g1_i2.p1 TRINITY_DN7944_c0_g1~~TRINITY_DN7944_c0_g1_i2.p1  ORF type:complete len:187 (-),score=59.95 TRINITY_DN7944_c0_g1_i2:253-813(-)